MIEQGQVATVSRKICIMYQRMRLAVIWDVYTEHSTSCTSCANDEMACQGVYSYPPRDCCLANKAAMRLSAVALSLPVYSNGAVLMLRPLLASTWLALPVYWSSGSCSRAGQV